MIKPNFALCSSFLLSFLCLLPSLSFTISQQLRPTSTTTTTSSSTTVTSNNPIYSFSLSFPGGDEIERALAVLLMLIGILLVFWGVRLFKVGLFVLTFIFTGGLIYYIIMTQTHDSKVALIVALVVGLLVSCLVICVYYLALVIVGASLGLVLWLGFHSLYPDVISNQSGLYALLAASIVVFALLAFVFEKYMLLFATPILGSFLFAQGLNDFFHMSMNAFAVLHSDDSCRAGTYCYLYSLGFCALAVLGLFVQYYVTSGLRVAGKTRYAPGIV